MLIITIVAIILQYIHALPCLTPYIYIPLFVQYILIKKKKGSGSRKVWVRLSRIKARVSMRVTVRYRVRARVRLRI